MVTADAVYTPPFNITDALYEVSGIGRSSFGLVGSNKDAFPVVTRTVVDGVVQYCNETYYVLLSGTGTFGCSYRVYSIVTTLDSRNFGPGGEVIELPVPSCAARKLARGALIAYLVLLMFAFFSTGAVWEALHVKEATRDLFQMWRLHYDAGTLQSP